uniref:ABC transporter permease n=1 Tax=Stomatobaculum longum TaxID=796942 RepID=UPI0028EED99F
NHFQDNFYKVSKNNSANFGGGNGGDVHIDPLKDTIFYIFPEGYKPAPKNNTSNSGTSGGGASAAAAPASVATETSDKPQKKYILDTAGILDGGSSGYNSYSYSVYCDIDTLKNFLKQRYRKYLVPEPKLNKKGKPVDYYVYSQAYVFVDDMNHVSEVQKKIAELGYQADSNMEWLEQSKQFTGMVQAVLGGIGAVSLLVAAIGIINTMMMSIYERTREIGVMKVLGCEMTNIRDLFLVESGFIGLMGGIIGTVLSLLISLLINFLAAQGGNEQLSVFYQNAEGGSISYIPPWLALFAIVFAIFIGAAAGYLPAKRAMRLSPLAAMRNE